MPVNLSVARCISRTSLIRTVHLVPGKCPYIPCKKKTSVIGTLYNTDTISWSQRANSYKLNLFITDTPVITAPIPQAFLFVITFQSVINCLIVHTIMYRHVIAIYHQYFLFFEDSPVVAFLFLPLFFSTFSLERLSLQTAGFYVRSKHFSGLHFCLSGSQVLVEVVDFLHCEASTSPCRHETLLSMIES